MGRGGWIVGGLAVAIAITAADGAQAASLTLVSPQPARQAITLQPGPRGGLVGRLDLLVRNGTRKAGRLAVRYFPTGDEGGGAVGVVSLRRPGARVPAGGLVGVELDASLPRGSSATDLHGIAQLSLQSKRVTVSGPLDVEITGDGPTFARITILPATVTLHSVGWAGPLSNPDGVDARVQLRGPGVAPLFAGRQLISTTVRLRSSTGHDVSATLKARIIDSGLATGTVSVGSSAPGSYGGQLPLSDLAASAPALKVELNSSAAFIWALLAVALGAIVGGGVYLASNLKRRKDVLEAYVRGSLNEYVTRRETLAAASAPGPMPLWKITGLGSQANWFRRKWTALPEIAGVQGIWSQIIWARNNSDLDDVQTRVITLRDRLRRWLQLAQGEDVPALQNCFKLQPADPAGQVWIHTGTYGDTATLLRELREVEPPDDPSTQSLIDRVVRQARWHAALATSWHMRGIIERDMATNPGAYTQNDHHALANIDLVATDGEACPEANRSAQAQLQLETRLDGWSATLIATYKGSDQATFLQVPGPLDAVMLGASTAAQVRAGTDAEVHLPAPVIATAAEQQPAPATQAEPEAGALTRIVNRTPGWIRELTVQDLLWTLVIVLVSAAAYVPTFYGPSWGTLGDYGSAFVAGFVGKLAINWAILPAFASLALRASSAASAPAQNS